MQFPNQDTNRQRKEVKTQKNPGSGLYFAGWIIEKALSFQPSAVSGKILNSKDKAIDLFKPNKLKANILERFVVIPSISLLEDPVGNALPRREQIFRKVLLVDRPVGAFRYFVDWIRRR